MKRRVLFRYALGLLALGLAIMALPASLEGPVLVNIGPGHAVAVLDAIGLVPLVLGCALLYGGLWAQQRQLARWVSGHQRAGSGVSSPPVSAWACCWPPHSRDFSGGAL